MIFNWLSVTLIVLTVLWLFSFILAIKNDDCTGIELLFWIGTIGLGLIGWVAIGHLYEAEDVVKDIVVAVAKTPTSLILTTNGHPILTLTDVDTYTKYGSSNTLTVTQTGWVDIYRNTNWHTDFKIKN